MRLLDALQGVLYSHRANFLHGALFEALIRLAIE